MIWVVAWDGLEGGVAYSAGLPMPTSRWAWTSSRITTDLQTTEISCHGDRGLTRIFSLVGHE